MPQLRNRILFCHNLDSILHSKTFPTVLKMASYSCWHKKKTTIKKHSSVYIIAIHYSIYAIAYIFATVTSNIYVEYRWISLIFLILFFDLCYYLTIFQLIEPKAKNEPVDWDKVAMFRTEVEKTVGYLENVWLKDRPFLCGNEISVADILGICELMQLNGVHEEKLYEDNAVVKAWAERVKKRLQPHFDEAHKMTFRTREMYPTIAKQLAKL